MLNSFFNNSNNNEYVSDYPPVFYTNGNNQQNSYTPSQSNGILSSLLNSDLLKEILPLFLGNKKDNNINFMSLLKNINPNFNNIISGLNLFNNKENATKNDNTKQNINNIIDMSEYEEIN